LLLSAGCSIPPQAAFRHEAEPVETSADFAGCRQFEADLRNAELTIEGWDQPEVKVTARVWAKAYLLSSAKLLAETTEVKLDRAGDRVALVCRPTRPMLGNEQVGASLLVYLPTDASMDVATRHGSVAAKAIRGEVCAESRFGNITLNQPEGAIRCETRHGRITVDHAKGPVDCKSMFGSIKLSEPAGPVTCQTRHGNVHVSGAQSGQVTCSTTFGNIKASIAPGCWHGEAVSLKTRHGRVELKMETAAEP